MKQKCFSPLFSLSESSVDAWLLSCSWK